MWDLFKAELLRFRGWAIGIAGLHLLVLGFLTRVVDLGQQPWLVHLAFGIAYGAVGGLLGLYQMGVYRRPGTWLNLLHRPLAPARTAAALLAAGAVLLAFTAALPVLVVAGWQAGMTARVVDARHLLLALAGLQIAGCGYLAGAYAMLANRRHAAAGLVFLAWLPAMNAIGLAALALQMVALLWLLALVMLAFQPDLGAPPRRWGAVLLTALPLQMGVYLVLLLLWFGVEMLWIMQGSHPNNRAVPAPGGHNELERLDDRARLLAGLAASASPDAQRLREQVALSEPMGIAQQLRLLPHTGELTNVKPMAFDDTQRRVRWTFSHDSMRLQGLSLVDGRAAGTLGVGAANAAFPVPVLPIGRQPFLAQGDELLAGGNTLYQYDSLAGRVMPRLQLPAGELLLGVSMLGAHLGALSDKAAYIIDGRLLRNPGQGLLQPRQRVPLPGPGRFGDLSDLTLIELVDGHLFSCSFTRFAHDPRGVPPYQVLLRTDDAGQVQEVARRAVGFDYPALFRYRAWWSSPVMSEVLDRARALLAPPDALRATHPAPVPRDVKLLAAAMSLLAALAAAWRVRQLPLRWPARASWVAACVLIGWPALVSLWLLVPAEEGVDAAPEATPRPAPPRALVA